MFSRVELEFLNEKAQVNEGYRRVIQHRINKKLETFKEDLDILSQNPKTRRWVNEVILSVTKNRNNVTGYSNTSQNHENLVLSSFIKNKKGNDFNHGWGCWDLNPGSREPESRSLDQTSRQPLIDSSLF